MDELGDLDTYTHKVAGMLSRDNAQHQCVYTLCPKNIFNIFD